jgi:tetratricopeptide (TPR) repeat protein
MMDAAGRAKDPTHAVEGAYDLLLFRPRDAQAITLAAHVLLFEAKDVEQARVLFREALRIEPDLPDALVGFARLEHDAGNRKEALRLAERAEEVAPGVPEVRRILGR